MVRERRAATRAIWNNLIPLEKQILVPKVLQNPPDGFDVFVRVRNIRVFEVDPVADAVGELLPILNVGED